MRNKTVEELVPIERAMLAAMKKYYPHVLEGELLRALTYQRYYEGQFEPDRREMRVIYPD